MTNLSPLAQPTPSERTLFRSIHSQFDPLKTRSTEGIFFFADPEREMLLSPVTSCKIFSTNLKYLKYFLPCTGYRRFCQCNCCNPSQISSRPSLQTHRSSGCQRWGIVCGFRPWNTNSQWTDYYEIYPAGQFVSLVWRWILYLPSGGKLRGGSITKQGILPFK